MTSYWIADAYGTLAVVEGVDQRDLWTRVRGWRLAGEPGPADRVYVVHDEAGPGGPLPFEALADGWTAFGWKPGPPPEPVDVTKDPALRDQPTEPLPPKPKTPAASGAAGKTEEK